MEIINYTKARELFKSPDGKRQRTYTISNPTDKQWRHFVEMYSNSQITPGNGINSAMTELAFLLMIATVSGDRLVRVANIMKEALYPGAIEGMRQNLLDLHDALGS